MAEHSIALQAKRFGQGVYIGSHLRQRPGAFRCRVRFSLGAFIDKDQAIAIGQWIEVVAEHMVIQSRSAVQNDDRVASTALDHVQPRVADRNFVFKDVHLSRARIPLPLGMGRNGALSFLCWW